MINRYPHTVQILLKAVVTTDDGLVGSTTNEETERDLQCRIEIKPNNKGEYNAILYADLQEVSLFKNDGLHLSHDGREFKVLTFQQMQTHLKAWLV